MSRGERVGRVGVFGGTFNPIHLAHLRAAEEALEALGLARVLFVPSAQPPHKLADRHGPLAPADQRLAWVRRAVRDNPYFAVDALELERGGPSYSVETLRELGERLAGERLVFLIGWDAFVEIDAWREPEVLFTLADFAVLTRPLPGGADGPATLAAGLPKAVRDDVELAADGRSARHRSAGSEIALVAISALDISASDIRARLREGRSVRYLLPEGVRQAVESSGVYGLPASEK